MEYVNLYYNLFFPQYLYRLEGQTLVKVFPNIPGTFRPFKELTKSKARYNWEGSVQKLTTCPYTKFANLDPDNPQALLRYANECGIPTTPSTYHFSRKLGVMVTSVTSWHPHPYPLKEFKKQILKMRAILDLKALSEKWEKRKPSSTEIENLDLLLCQAGIKNVKDFSYKQWGARVPKMAFEYAVNMEIVGVMPVIQAGPSLPLSWEKRFLYRDLLQALYMMIYEDISQSVAKCANNKCTEYFVVDYGGKIYCGHNCAVNVARRKHYHNHKTKGVNHGKEKRKG